ncbi:uncharacterized protein LOC131858255 [Cryptomeria japonica]|uniref:uncharacterized protein LOC131858255 n=1 Tax=Cryptomeria japonica TaxID=3369 RepID=UPI0027DA88CE|nr:uncharacterized protein LOC131858255 [Cryptomeria japonica]
MADSELRWKCSLSVRFDMFNGTQCVGFGLGIVHPFHTSYLKLIILFKDFGSAFWSTEEATNQVYIDPCEGGGERIVQSWFKVSDLDQIIGLDLWNFVTTGTNLSNELLFLILQFLDEERLNEMTHKLEQESGCTLT